MKKVVVLISVAMVIGMAIWFAVAGRVLIEWRVTGAICEPPTVILNPLRDRQVEAVADDFLSRLQLGDFAVLDRPVRDDDQREMIQKLENELKIKSWFAAGGSELGEQVSIQYWLTRDYRHGCQHVPATITLIKVDNRWVVIGYNPIY